MRTSILRPVLSSLLPLLFAGTAAAQFSQFTWSFDSGGSGTGSVTADTMVILGPDANTSCPGATCSFTATAPFDLVLVADFDVQDGDKGGDADWLVTIIDGVETTVSGQCSGCQLVLEVPADSSFGFGVHSFDCVFGAAQATLTHLIVQPAPQTLAASGTLASGQFGAALAAFADVTGDGVPELAIGAPTAASEAGRVTLHDGATLAVIRTLAGAAGDRFGAALAAVGDQDGDGVGDLLIGAPHADIGFPNNGAARLYSGQTALLLSTLPGAAGADEFGRALADAGDLDGDGLDDLLIGAPRHDGPGADAGQAVVLAGGTHVQLAAWSGSAAGDQFGAALAGTGDVDGDGVPDVLIGAPMSDLLGSNSGRAQLFSGATGALLHELAALACNGDANDGFGTAVAGVGDVNGDGVPDVAVGAPGDGCVGHPSAGTLRVYSGLDAHVLYTVQGIGSGQQLGASLARVGDVNGDGTPDLLVGSPTFVVPAQSGRVQFLSGNDGQLLLAVPGTALNDGFGSAVAALGDTDGDGLADALIGAPAPIGSEPGSAQIVRPKFLWTDLGHGLAGSAGTPALAGTGLLAPDTPLALTLEDAAPGHAATVVIGLDALLAPFKGGVLVPQPDLLLTGLVTGASPWTIGGHLPAGLPAGSSLYFQTWIADVSASKGLAASNGLRGDIH